MRRTLKKEATRRCAEFTPIATEVVKVAVLF
jgi:hypothetical protein